ncbi:response regulator transcription factor [Peredibacter starrii]|uniref:Response regulator transcription factor n=1 Tax=Peredibacter starrii TaxID=28202 RepID=A0AAX4HN68_9BACT|nr:response regulator transcription factor [Peredibacter starrii]WPU64593.1 response regulator transcription factor [Peredibacter starrii]
MEKNRMHVTIIDDNKDLLEVLSSSLSDQFTIESFTEPDKGLDFIRNNHTDAILLDLHIPGKDGFQVYEEVKRAKQNLPVLFLTGDSDMGARVKGLEIGADDFLLKPVQTEELVARIRNRIALSKRNLQNNKVIKFKDLVIDLDGHQVILNNQAVRLTPKEYQLLLVLSQNPNRVIHKDDLIHMLWKDVHVEVNNLDTHFSNLRRKLKPFSTHIKTLKNLGYVLRI